MAIALDPEYASAYLSRAALYDDYGMKKEALADYQKFLELADYKTDSEILEAYQKHQHLADGPVYEPLADPLEIARVKNKFDRDIAQVRVQELRSYDEKEN